MKPAVAYKAEQLAINKAYANLGPQQIALTNQLMGMANAWDDLKNSLTPVVSGALQPWLKAVTDLTKQLAPIIAAVSPVIHGLGVQFDALINSAAFRAFRDFIANTGSAALGAMGGTLIDFLKAGMILLADFNPLIEKTVGWLAGLGPAVLKWAQSKKTADDITKFMAWFAANGPVVGDLLKNIGKALATLAPGLTAGGAFELKVISDFFGFVAKLPKGIAAPLAEVAGALLILNKLGVFSVGVKLIGMDAAAAVAGGGAMGLWGKILPGVRLLGGALVAAVAVEMVLKSTSSGPGGKNWWDNPGGADPTSTNTAKQGVSTWAGLGNQITQIWDMVWRNTITRTAAGFHDLAQVFDRDRHQVSASWDGLAADIVNIWNSVWNNTIPRTAKGFHDVAGWFDTGRHWIAGTWDQIRHDAAAVWDLIWNNTIGRIQRGFHDVAGLFDTGRRNIASTWNQVRSDAASAWDTIWNNTVARVSRGISDVMTWFRGLPGKITAALGAAGSLLAGWGKGVINGLLSGMTSVIGSVWDFIKGIPGKILSFLGIKSPPQWAIDAGKHIMNGLGIGMAQAQTAGQKALAAYKQSVASAAGGGHGPTSADAAAAQSYARSRLSAYGWAVDQMLPLISLWNQESGWSRFAYNASSGATGIPQALPYTKMPRAAWLPSQGGQASAGAQIDWGLGYIKGRYGSPAGAWGHEVANNWYASGTASALPGWAWVGERGPELLHFRGGEEVRPASGIPLYAIPGGTSGPGDLAAELRALRGQMAELIRTTAAVPAATGAHVGGYINGAAGDAGFRNRYPQGGY